VTEQLRIGDAERERAAADLGEHFAQGRLTADEHAERLERVWVAKTSAELVPLFRDLPGGAYGARPAVPAPRSAAPDRRRGRALPFPLFPVVALLVVVTVVTHVPVVLFGLIAFVVLSRGGPWRNRRYHSLR